MDPRIIEQPLSAEDLQGALPNAGDMVKVVVDVARKVLALGGELHADGEALLLGEGSRQEDLWGANIFRGDEGRLRIEYVSLINIRPRQGNRDMEIQDPALRATVEGVIHALVPPL